MLARSLPSRLGLLLRLQRGRGSPRHMQDHALACQAARAAAALAGPVWAEAVGRRYARRVGVVVFAGVPGGAAVELPGPVEAAAARSAACAYAPDALTPWQRGWHRAGLAAPLWHGP